MLIFNSFKVSGSTFSLLHLRLLKSFKEATISQRHLGKSILDGNLYLGSLETILRTLASEMTFSLPEVTCPAEGYKKSRFSTISGVRSNGIYIYTNNNFIKVKNSRPNWFVILIKQMIGVSELLK